ncbi:MAG: peptide-N-glycosidase F-related protein, partial [Bacteroidales bacterium]
GYKASLKFNFDENKAPTYPMSPKKVEPLINTVYYVGQSYPGIFADQDVKVDFEIPANAKNVELKYIVTGHGGHSGGDEFVKKENILSIDGDTVYQFIPWRTDCATFRRYNPTSGVWLRGRTAAYIDSKKGGYAEKNIEETIASSDLSRSNWCPGSDVAPQVIELNDIKPGKHTLTISIPEAQAIDGDKMNHWLVSSYLTWEE